MSGTDATMNELMVAAPPRDRWSRVALKLASMIRCGHLTVVLPDGSTHRIKAPHDGPDATVVLKDRQAIKKLVMGGNIGLAEAYIDGLWESPDLRAVMALAAANEAEWEAALAGSPFMRAINTVLHRLRPNTRKGAKHFPRFRNCTYGKGLGP